MRIMQHLSTIAANFNRGNSKYWSRHCWSLLILFVLLLLPVMYCYHCCCYYCCCCCYRMDPVICVRLMALHHALPPCDCSTGECSERHFKTVVTGWSLRNCSGKKNTYAQEKNHVNLRHEIEIHIFSKL